MPRKASYGYGYGQTPPDLMQSVNRIYTNEGRLTDSRLRNINVPQKLKCHYCNKNYNQASFSKKQLDEVRLQIQTSGKIVQNPKCNKCTGARVFELECVMCHKTKGEKEFSKTQRKVPDDAVCSLFRQRRQLLTLIQTCYACIELQVKQEPVNEEDYEDPSRAFLTGLHSQGNYPDYFAPKALPKDSIVSTTLIAVVDTDQSRMSTDSMPPPIPMTVNQAELA
jgi:hypothetical protein